MPIIGDAESHGPRRPAPSAPRAPVQTPRSERLHWRAVVHVGGKLDAARGQPPLAWHLAACAAPDRPESHCEVGRLLMATDGNPDGHCQIDAACPRCREPSGPLGPP